MSTEHLKPVYSDGGVPPLTPVIMSSVFGAALWFGRSFITDSTGVFVGGEFAFRILFPLCLGLTAMVCMYASAVCANARFHCKVPLPFMYPSLSDMQRIQKDFKPDTQIAFLNAVRAHHNLLEALPVIVPVFMYLMAFSPYKGFTSCVYGVFLSGRALNAVQYSQFGASRRLAGFLPAVLSMYVMFAILFVHVVTEYIALSSL